MPNEFSRAAVVFSSGLLRSESDDVVASSGLREEGAASFDSLVAAGSPRNQAVVPATFSAWLVGAVGEDTGAADDTVLKALFTLRREHRNVSHARAT